MAINLSKSNPINLTKSAPKITRYLIGLGWDIPESANADLDFSMIAKDANGKASGDQDFVFYNANRHPSGAIEVGADNRTGAGSGYDEAGIVDLAKLPESIAGVDFILSIHEPANGVNFGSVSNVMFDVFDGMSGDSIDEFKTKSAANGLGEALIRYNPSENYGSATAVVVAGLSKDSNGEWSLHAVGNVYANLEAVLAAYGLVAGNN